jgi:hypothetical protein
MDLVCLIDNKEAALHASDLVAMIGDLLERGECTCVQQFESEQEVDMPFASQKPTLRSSLYPRQEYLSSN